MKGPLADAALLARTAGALGGAGLATATRPSHVLPAVRAYLESGASLATLTAVAAVHAPHTPAVLDERGRLDYAELHRDATAIAGAIRAEHGIGEGSTVGVLCRNHRGFVLATVAATRLGAHVVLLNTEFSAPQLADVLGRHRPDLVLLDEEFHPLVDGVPTVVAWSPSGRSTMDQMASARHGKPPRPRKPGTLTLLTSGTTGTPKGAPRKPDALAMAGPMATMLRRSGLRVGDPVLVAPPLFHGLGLALFGLAVLLRAPVVLRPKFDATTTLADVERHRVRCLTVVPVMLQRILALPEQERRRHDLSSLRCVLSGAAPLPPALATRTLDELGDVLFNGYGSSEIGIATIATPTDLRTEPGTVGKPAIGVPVEVLENGRPVAPGVTGTVHVGGKLVFGGYTGGGSKDVVQGLMSTGDRGHFDTDGRLYIDGRADDMIVSGGENVYPQEVEDVLTRHGAVADAAVLGVPDEEFGQRLVAYVVARPGTAPDEEELKRHVRDNLARYKVPRAVVFLDELPRNPTGKLLRRALPPVPDGQ